VLPRAATGGLVRDLARDLGAVLVAWAFVVVAEFVVIGFTCAGLFAGNWELILGRRLVGPIALAMLVPAAVVVVALGRLAGLAGESARARLALSALAAMAAAAVGAGVSHGRHFASLAVRAPFVALLAGVAFVGVGTLTPPIVRLVAGPRGRVASAVGVAGAVAFWLVDARVLPRLYPAFHSAAFALLLGCSALTVLAWRVRPFAPASRGELALAFVGLAAAAAAVAWAPAAARGLSRSDNLRFVLEEHAPVLGRAVHVAAWLSPPEPVELDASAAAATVGEVPRALDWSGQDIVVVSIDALRADHVGAYGYARKTTPNIDALASQGAVFEHAYCPTPHTSYSVTSMMTGKAMRPLLSLGLGKESETWATYLRRYGYKTAAFYPPAVFYIDQDRFTDFESSGLGFEYRWVEFTSAEAKVKEVDAYLRTAGPEPLFIWVHLFEPHEPYVAHAGFDGFGEGGARLPVDVYDGEVAYADAAVGELLRVVRARRPGVTVILTADHGEEFGDHGGRYHGTTCYEEQVRVPLVVSGPRVARGRVPAVVQTIDLLPTVLSALGIPRPARVRGRDLGALLAGLGRTTDAGLAYAETDDQTLLARGSDRLVCARKIAACALYDVATDPAEHADRAPSEPAKVKELRGLLAGVLRDQGRYEVAETIWPDAIRRGLEGEADAAVDVAALLDDASVVIRRKAAEVTYRLAARDVVPQARRALARDEDEEVKRWASLALVKMGDPVSARADALVRDADKKWRRAAAMAFATAGDARGKEELAAYWQDEGPPRAGLDTEGAKELLAAIERVRDREAVPALLASLDYVPLRARVAEVIGRVAHVGDARARARLLSVFAGERHETARVFEARALVALGASVELLPPLARFAGLSDPMAEAVDVALAAKILAPASGGQAFEPAVTDADVEVTAPAGVPLRLWVESGGAELSVKVDGETQTGAAVGSSGVWSFDVLARSVARLRVQAHDARGVRAAWVVARVVDAPAVAADAGR
jgi:arylsulfatase A-like enzyme